MFDIQLVYDNDGDVEEAEWVGKAVINVRGIALISLMASFASPIPAPESGTNYYLAKPAELDCGSVFASSESSMVVNTSLE